MNHTMKRNCEVCSVYCLTVKNKTKQNKAKTTATEVTGKISFTEKPKNNWDQANLDEELI